MRHDYGALPLEPTKDRVRDAALGAAMRYCAPKRCRRTPRYNGGASHCR